MHYGAHRIVIVNHKIVFLSIYQHVQITRANCTRFYACNVILSPSSLIPITNN